MDKKLLISVKEDMNCYLWYALKLAILDPENSINYRDWFYSHFINPITYCYKNSNTYKLDYIEYFDELKIFGEVLDIEVYMFDKAIKNEVVKCFIDHITNGKYLEIEVDYYYLSDSRHYQSIHYTHPVLVYGYSNNHFDIVSFVDNVYKSMRIEFDELRVAYNNALEINSNLSEAIIAYRVITKKSECIKKYNVNSFISEIDNCREGKGHIDTSIKFPKGLNNIAPIKIGFRAYLEMIKCMKNYDHRLHADYRAIHFMYEQNIQLYKRIMYWKDFLNITQTDIINCLDIIKQCNLLRMIFLKRQLKYNKGSINDHPEEFKFFAQRMEDILKMEQDIWDKICCV